MANCAGLSSIFTNTCRVCRTAKRGLSMRRVHTTRMIPNRETLARWQESLLFHTEVGVHRALARLAQAMRIAQLGAGPVEYLRSFEPAYAGPRTGVGADPAGPLGRRRFDAGGRRL